MPVESLLQAPPQILNAIAKGAKKTGADFDYLVKTAARESSFDPAAKANTSTATGLFQFVENTWLETMKESGERLGLGHYAKQISIAADGEFYVANKAARQEILRLRDDPHIASALAGAYTQKNESVLNNRLGRAPSDGELYMAHFLGATNAARLIELERNQPNIAAQLAFPVAAKSNPGIFQDANGARTIREVYNLLASKQETLDVANVSPTKAPTKESRDKILEPLVSMQPRSPMRYLFGNDKISVGSEGDTWGSLIQPKSSNPVEPPKTQDAPPAWSKGGEIVPKNKTEDKLGTDSSSDPHQTFARARLTEGLGSRKDFKV